MENFFLQHSVLRDRDPDELGGRVNSDSEVSDDEEITDRVHSVADPTGPWTQKFVDGDTWGKPTRTFCSGNARDFASVNTGPKGVINDYKAHKRYQKEERRRNEAERQAVLNRITKGATVPFTLSALNSSGHFECEFDACSDCEYDDEDLVDDAILTQYAKMRMKEVQEAACKREIYGELEYITPERFVTLISKADNTNLKRSMLVHLYHPDNYACELLNSQLEILARKLVYIKFTAMVANQADASIKMADLPVVLVFRGQEQEVIVDVARLLNGEFTLDQVEAFINERIR